MSAKFFRIDLLISCILFVAIGGAGGWVLSSSFAPGSKKKDPHAGHGAAAEEEADPHAGHDHGAEGGDDHLSPATLKNLGVTVGKIKKTNYQKYRAVPAVVAQTPFSELPLHAPMGGRVQKILVEQGMLVKAGQTLLTIIRDPIPRPELKYVEGVLNPSSEEIHKTIAELRKARAEIQIFETELNRIKKYTNNAGGDGLPVLPLKTTIDLKYNLSRAQKMYDLAKFELSKHGFSDEQVKGVATNAPIPLWSVAIWKRALKKNGLWSASAELLLSNLPKDLQQQTWVVATVGELAARDLIKPALAIWFKKDPKASENFLEIASLLQTGHSVPGIKALYVLNAFHPIIEIKAQNGHGATDFDVHEILVKLGSRVEAGTPLINLSDPRSLYLEAAPVGQEKADILKAVEKRSPCKATSLVKGVGPTLENLTIAYVTNRTDHPQGADGTVAVVEIENQPLAINKDKLGRTHRTWKLRPGVRYNLLVPTRVMNKVFVLPSSAITKDGPNKVVFIQDGDSFRTINVEIAYQDHEHAIIPINKHTELFPGDPIVLSGAFALGLALKTGSGAIDPHAGHNH